MSHLSGMAEVWGTIAPAAMQNLPCDFLSFLLFSPPRRLSQTICTSKDIPIKTTVDSLGGGEGGDRDPRHFYILHSTIYSGILNNVSIPSSE